MKKRVLAMLLMAVMLIGVFCGCGDSSDSSDSSDSTDTESKEQGIPREVLEDTLKSQICYENGINASWRDNGGSIKWGTLLDTACPKGYTIDCVKYDYKTAESIWKTVDSNWSSLKIEGWDYDYKKLLNIHNETYDKSLDKAYLVWATGQCVTSESLLELYKTNPNILQPSQTLVLYIFVFGEHDQLIDTVLYPISKDLSTFITTYFYY